MAYSDRSELDISDETKRFQTKTRKKQKYCYWCLLTKINSSTIVNCILMYCCMATFVLMSIGICIGYGVVQNSYLN